MIHIFDNITSLMQSSIIIIAAIIGCFNYKKYKHSVVRFFIYFLVYLAFFECLMYYTYSVRYNGVLSFLDTTILRQNYWLGALYWKIGAMLFYSWFFSKFIKNKFYKKAIKLLSVLFLVYAIIIISTQIEKFFGSSSVPIRIAGNTLLLISISLYFVDVLKSNNLLIFYKTNIFYIASIIFIWLLITMPLGFYNQYFNLKDPAYIKLRSAIYFYVNFFMYIGFTLVLIFGKPEKISND